MSGALRSAGRVVLVLAGIALVVGTAGADGILPVTLKLEEQESNRFLAQWRVSKQLPPQAIPSPVLPASCRTVGERSITERAGAWLVRQAYRCPEGLAGREIGIDYPFLNATVSTLLQVEFLSGDRHAHMLAPGERTWRVPSETAGDARVWYRMAREGVLGGARHFAGNGVHLAFVLVLVLLGGLDGSIRLVSAYSVGQVAGVAGSAAVGLWLATPLAEIGVAAAAAVLAREALRPPDERRQLILLAASAGLVHGLGMARMVPPAADYDGPGIVFYLLVVLGMDASLLLAAAVGSGLRRLLPERSSRPGIATAAAYLIGVLAIALVFAFPAADATTASDEASRGIRVPDLPIPAGASGSPVSRRVATSFPDAPLQSFIAIAPFEVRHEVLVRLRDLTGRIGLEPTEEVAIEAQDEVKQRIRDLVAERTELTIDGRVTEPTDGRVDFLGLDSRGALPRLAPIPEPVDTAWIGVTTVYVTERTPVEVGLTWTGFETEPTVPATVTDPESSRSVELSMRQPTLFWKNDLAEDPTPVVSAIAVRPALLWMPIASLIPLGLAMLLGVASFRRGRRELSVAIARIGLAFAALVAPIGNVAVSAPTSVDRTPDPARARRILARVLPNVYRAFEYPTESTVYDRLALSVTGDTLTEIYLENRRAVRMEERGGARAAVEAVEVVEVESVEPGTPDGFVAVTTWTVGGTVTHFGHRHFRQNRYDARVTLVPVDGYWKIRSLEVFDEKRVR